MTLMTVNNHEEQGKDRHFRSRLRWSAGKKTDAVLRLLRGESLEQLSRELKVEAHRLAAWRDDFRAAGKTSKLSHHPGAVHEEACGGRLRRRPRLYTPALV